MPEQYVVPQFLDVEDKILGPLTVRQFLIMLVTAGIIFVTYKLADFGLFIILGLLFLAMGLIIAFFKVNGQPFHYFLLNLLQTFKRPQLRVWNKELTDLELRAYLKVPPPPPSKPKIAKAPLAATRLSELALIVNTGGVYRPEE